MFHKKLYKYALTIALISCGCVFQTAFAQTQLGADIDGVAASARSGIGESVSISTVGNTVAIGSPGNNLAHVRVFRWGGSSWTQLGSDIEGSEGSGDWFGYAIALSATGTRIVIGAYGDNTNGSYSGRVEVYSWNGSNWNQLGNDIYGFGADDQLGSSVSISSDGNRIAIGGEYIVARVYEWNGSEWVNINGSFGGGRKVSLSADGNRVAAGDPLNNEWRGEVRIYEYDGSNWGQLGADINGESREEVLGTQTSLSPNGNRVAGVSGGLDYVRIFEWLAGAWARVGLDIKTQGPGGDGRSTSMSADGNIIAVGSPLSGGNGHWSGHVRVYAWSGSEWKQIGSDIDGEAAEDRSGTSVSLSADGKLVAIGAPYNDGNGSDSGHVRVYSIEMFTVGGSVNGLSGSGLVLQNNAGDDLAIGSNGDFTFSTALVNGNGYAVTVKTQPSSPSQICSTTNGSGTLAGADAISALVTCVSTCNVSAVPNTIEYFEVTHEACEDLMVGPNFIAADGSNVTVNSGWNIDFLPGFLVEQGAIFNANVCGQSLCITSPSPMPLGCHSCVDLICASDASCCNVAFDQTCLDMVDTTCGLVCE